MIAVMSSLDGEYLQTKRIWCEPGDEIQDPFVLKL